MNASRIGKQIATLALGASLLIGLGSSIAGAQSTGGKPVASQAQGSSSGVVDINAASAVELESLPGVGPSRAKAIVEMREQMKGFRRLEDLMRVKGIGRKTFQKLSPLVTLGNAPKSASPSAATKDTAEAKR